MSARISRTSASRSRPTSCGCVRKASRSFSRQPKSATPSRTPRRTSPTATSISTGPATMIRNSGPTMRSCPTRRRSPRCLPSSLVASGDSSPAICLRRRSKPRAIPSSTKRMERTPDPAQTRAADAAAHRAHRANRRSPRISRRRSRELKVPQAAWIDLLARVVLEDRSWTIDEVLLRHGLQRHPRRIAAGADIGIAKGLIDKMNDADKRSIRPRLPDLGLEQPADIGGQARRLQAGDGPLRCRTCAASTSACAKHSRRRHALVTRAPAPAARAARGPIAPAFRSSNRTTNHYIRRSPMTVVEGLLAHRGAQLCRPARLAGPPHARCHRHPQADSRTMTVVQSLIETLGFRRLNVVSDQYAVTPDGMRMFGVLALDVEVLRHPPGDRLVRNSHDKSCSLALTVGLQGLRLRQPRLPTATSPRS